MFFDDGNGGTHVFYRSIRRGWSHPKHVHGGSGTPQNHARAQEFGTDVPAQFEPGDFLPRVWRGLEHPPSKDIGLYEAEISTRRVVGTLCSRLDELFWHVEPQLACAQTFSHELRAMLILACTEVESSWKAVLAAHRYAGNRWTTNDYVKLDAPLHLREWTVVLEQHPAWGPIQPFAGWSIANPTGSLAWYDAYNAAKHDREQNLSRATLRSVIDATAAAYVMMIAQFGWSITVEDVLRVPLSKRPEVFNLTAAPSWAAEEEYVAPLEGSPVQLGASVWRPKLLQF